MSNSKYIYLTGAEEKKQWLRFIFTIEIIKRIKMVAVNADR